MEDTIVKVENLDTPTLQRVLDHARATHCTFTGEDGIEECAISIWVEAGSYDYLFKDSKN
jgi:hypothetical protein